MDSEAKAVIVVDMQKDNVGAYCTHIIPKIRELLNLARQRGLLVVFACDTRLKSDKIFDRVNMTPHTLKGTEGWEIIDMLEPAKEDLIIEKPMLSAFFSSELDLKLRERGIDKIIVCGVRTEGCVLKTVLDAFELGYDITLPVDCVASPSQRNHDSIIEILDILNIKKIKVDELSKNI